MNLLLNNFSAVLNDTGRWFCNYGFDIFIQSGILIILLLIIDFLLRKRVRATFRYWIWMLVLLKLMLPPALSLPTGIGHWLGNYLPAQTSISKQVSYIARLKPAGASAPQDPSLSAEIPQIHLSQVNPEPAAPAFPVISDSQAFTWQVVVFVIWFTGAAVLSVLLIHRILFVRRLIAQSEPVRKRYADILDQCCQQLGIKRQTELRLSGKLQSPAVCGFVRPVILMPTCLLETLSTDKLRAVLIHELAHIKRGDLWVNCLQTFLQIIYFYNPLVWLANAVIRRIREQAVDEMVLVALAAGAKDYSNTLIDIAEMSFFKTSLSLRLIGVVESKKALRRRIRHILNRPIPKSAKLGALGLVVVIVSAAVLLPMAKAQKQNPEIIETEQINSRFTATLPNGVKVELLGVCRHPSEGKQWWRPDGSKLSQRPFEKRYQQSQKRGFYELALKIENPENRKLRIISKGGSVFNLYPDNIWGGLVLSEGKKMLNQSIGIAQGPWKTIMEANPMHTQSFGDIAFGKAFESDIEGIGVAAGVTATHTVDEEKVDYRIIAVDQKNHIHTSSGSSGIGNNLWLQTTVHFKDLQIDEIKEFQFQTRPYQWVEFKNVSLKPDMKTDVQVEVLGERETRLVMEGGQINVLKGENGPDVVVRRKLPPEGTAYYKKFGKEYLLEIVSKSSGQNITETIGRESSGETSGPEFVQKRIGFGIPFVHKEVDRFRKKVEFQRKLRENIKKDIKDILGVTASGSKTITLQHLEYSTDKVVGSVTIHCSQNDEDILQLQFTIHEVVTAENKTNMQVDIEAREINGGLISGIVISQDGEPIEGATVLPSRRGDNYRASLGWTAETDNNGRFTGFYERIDEGKTTTLIVKAAGYAPVLREIKLSADALPLQFQLGPGQTIRGLVIDQDGNPIKDVAITACKWGEYKIDNNNLWKDHTDSQGRFVWTEAPQDQVEFYAYESNHLFAHCTMSPAEKDYVITLKPAIKVHGKVTDAETDEPIKTFRLMPLSKYIPGHGLDIWQVDAEVYTDGQFEFLRLKPYSGQMIGIEAEGYKAAVSAPLNIQEGELVCDFKLHKAKDSNDLTILPGYVEQRKARDFLSIVMEQQQNKPNWETKK